MGRFFKNQDANEGGSYGTDAGPYGVRSSDGETLGGLYQQNHTEGEGQKEAAIPGIHFGTGGFFGLAEAGGEGHFKQPGDDEEDPVHSWFLEGANKTAALFGKRLPGLMNANFYGMLFQKDANGFGAFFGVNGDVVKTLYKLIQP